MDGAYGGPVCARLACVPLGASSSAAQFNRTRVGCGMGKGVVGDVVVWAAEQS